MRAKSQSTPEGFLFCVHIGFPPPWTFSIRSSTPARSATHLLCSPPPLRKPARDGRIFLTYSALHACTAGLSASAFYKRVTGAARVCRGEPKRARFLLMRTRALHTLYSGARVRARAGLSRFKMRPLGKRYSWIPTRGRISRNQVEARLGALTGGQG